MKSTGKGKIDLSRARKKMLTPNHLSYGHRLGTLPDETVDGEDDDLKGRLDYLNKRMTHFWNRWKQEYLVNLHEYHRSNGGAENVVKENDIVLVHEDHVPRGK